MSNFELSNLRNMNDMSAKACNCIGPQNGAPLCPCRMEGVMVIDGRYVQAPKDLGPVNPIFEGTYK